MPKNNDESIITYLHLPFIKEDEVWKEFEKSDQYFYNCGQNNLYDAHRDS